MSEPVRIIVADVLAGLAQLADQSVHCCVTSPPYWGLRDYGVEGQIGLEPTPEAFVARMVEVFAAVRRVLRDDGTVFLNLGDSYAGNGGGGGTPSESLDKSTDRMIAEKRTQRLGGLKPKDLCMIPWRVALALQSDGWYLRSVIVWHKRSPMPESVTDRPTSSWEPIFLLAKSERYYYDAEAVKEPANMESQRGTVAPLARDVPDGLGKRYSGFERERYKVSERNQRNVWTLGPEPFSDWYETDHWEDAPSDAVGDGIRRTPSEDCPVHGCRGPRPSGERAGDSSSDNHGIGARHDPAPQPAPVSSSLNPDGSALDGSLDSARPGRSQTANGRSTRTRKTARAPVTIPPCTPSAQTDTGTPGTSVSPASCVPHRGSPVSTSSAGSAPDASGSCLSVQTTAGSVGTCTCKYHRLVTKKTSHFATFPSEIPRRAIKAGTSERGCCPECGAGWVRKVDGIAYEPEIVPVGVRNVDASRGDKVRKLNGRSPEWLAAAASRRTIGWSPSCTCPAAEPVPAVVLDPFLGSGTTVAVARELGRRGIGIELNPEYAELARIRIGKAEKPSTFQDPRIKDSPLFTEAH